MPLSNWRWASTALPCGEKAENHVCRTKTVEASPITMINSIYAKMPSSLVPRLFLYSYIFREAAEGEIAKVAANRAYK